MSHDEKHGTIVFFNSDFCSSFCICERWHCLVLYGGLTISLIASTDGLAFTLGRSERTMYMHVFRWSSITIGIMKCSCRTIYEFVLERFFKVVDSTLHAIYKGHRSASTVPLGSAARSLIQDAI